MAYIFLDESGQFSKNDGGKFFVIAAFTVGDPRRTEKSFRVWCKTRFPKKMKNRSEIKWSSSGIDSGLRLRTLKHISKIDVRVRYVYLLRKNIPIEYWEEEKLQSGLLYVNIVGELIDDFLPANDLEVRVFCDQRHLRGITSAQFRESIRGRILAKLPAKAIVQVDMVDSTSSPNIQIVDWIAGAIWCCKEEKKNGDKFMNILKDNILGDGRELFAKAGKGYISN
jgi:hypothetical protein